MHTSNGAVDRTVRVIWVRHGETADNARHVIQGHIDTPLNDNGIKQSKATKEALKDVKIDICFTSDLQRARKTAEIILEDYHDGTPLIVDKRIKEKYLGLMEGQVYYQARSPEILASIEPLQVFTDRLLSFWDDLFPPSSQPAANGSTMRTEDNDNHTQPNTCVQEGSSKPLLPASPRDLTILVVTHGGPVKVAFSALPQHRKNILWERETLKMAKEVKFKVWNCSFSEITMIKTKAGPGQPISGWSGVIHRYADVDHLLLESAAPKEGTEGDADISNGEAGEAGPSAAEKAEAERQYHLDNATPWWQQTQTPADGQTGQTGTNAGDRDVRGG